METNQNMKPAVIRAFNLPDLWYRVLCECLDNGYERPVFRAAREGARRKEIDSAILIVTNPSHRPLVPETPEGVPAPTSLKYVHAYLQYLITPFKQDWEDYGTGVMPKYSMLKADQVEGQRVSALDINQLQLAIDCLKETPESNRAIIEVGKPEDLILRHPPCMRLIHLKVRYNKLHMWLYFRSWDAWGGLPSNLAALQLVKEFIGNQLGVKDGQIFAMSAGLHLYDGEWKVANMTRGRKV